MRILFSSLIVLLISCQSNKREKENITETHTINPWKYINRISDTLPEVGFSLFNSVEKNLRILKKYDDDFKVIKYRIGQGKFIKVYSRFIHSSQGGIICYFSNPFFKISINFNNEIMIQGNLIPNSNLNTIDSSFKNYILSTIDEENNKIGIPNAIFEINCSPNTNQEFIGEIIDHLANGYYLYLNPNPRKAPFSKYGENLQNKIMKNIPFGLNYDFYELMGNNTPPALQRGIENQCNK